MLEPLAGNRSSLARAVVAAGLAFLAAVAAVAVLQLLGNLNDLLVAAPRRMGGAAGWLMVVGGLAGIAILLAAGMIAARSRLADPHVLLIGLAAVAAVRGAAVVFIQAPVPTDGVAYAELARWLASGGCCFADRPTGYPMLLAAAFRILGDASWVHGALNVAAALAGGWFVWDMLRSTAGRPSAAVALFAYAALPSQVLLTPVLLADVVFATLLLVICWLSLRVARGSWQAALGGGLLLAVSQYVRPVGPALLPAIALVPALWVRPARRAVGSVLLLGAAFTVAMMPIVTHNLAEHGALSVSTSSFGGWSLFIGTDQAHNGRVSDQSIASIQALPGESLWDRSELAGELGLRRIIDDPAGFAGLAVRKFRIMWGTEDFGVDFAFRPDGPPRGALAGLDLANQLVYVPLVLSALAASALIVRSRRQSAPLVVLIVAILLSEAAIHTFLEVKPRYHAHLEPLLLVLGAPVVATALGRRPWRSAAYYDADSTDGGPVARDG